MPTQMKHMKFSKGVCVEWEDLVTIIFASFAVGFVTFALLATYGGNI